MEAYSFAAASPTEEIVFGACRPGYDAGVSEQAVTEWIEFMQKRGIERVCCLLDAELGLYESLLVRYEEAFGSDRVKHAPIDDYSGVSESMFCEEILPFLVEANEESEQVAVHCSAGMGRTGHVLTLWLMHGRDKGVDEAIRTVEATGRNPLESVPKDYLANITC